MNVILLEPTVIMGIKLLRSVRRREESATEAIRQWAVPRLSIFVLSLSMVVDDDNDCHHRLENNHDEVNKLDGCWTSSVSYRTKFAIFRARKILCVSVYAAME
jgi:hypothetical protein